MAAFSTCRISGNAHSTQARKNSAAERPRNSVRFAYIVRESDRAGEALQQTRLSRSSGSWNDPRFRAILLQTIIVAIVCAFFGLVAMQTASNLRTRSIASGFHFLGRAAGFEISAGPLSYSSRDSYARHDWRRSGVGRSGGGLVDDNYRAGGNHRACRTQWSARNLKCGIHTWPIHDGDRRRGID